MRSVQNISNMIGLALALVVMSSPVQAHLMAAQHGTLNFVDDGAFMLLSLPISAFEGVDDNHDGKISMLEFNHHRAAIVASVKQNISLSDPQGNLPLEGVMLSPVVPHDAPDNAISHLAVMGRFAITDSDTTLIFHVGLYGKQENEQTLEITASRKTDNQKHAFEITPEASTRQWLFASG